MYGKSNATIGNWISKYETEGSVERRKTIEVTYKKFGKEKRNWLIHLYADKPILYLDEAKALFFKKFGITISASSISLILHQAGLTWKTLERRAIQIQINDILRFCTELMELDWTYESLIFLDEVSFDKNDMLRKRGYAIKGERLIYRGEFGRSARISLLCFLGVNGIVNVYKTDGTFTRSKFVSCCRSFATDYDSIVEQYPGKYSVWLLDGAKIHCHEKIVIYLRSLGIMPIFLPSYCPFFNPIEIVFGLAKGRMKKLYVENAKMDKNIIISDVLSSFHNKKMNNLFKKCGYLVQGKFNPSYAMAQDLSSFGFETS